MYFQTPPSEMLKPIPATYVRVWWQCRNGHNLDINWTGAIYNLQVISVIISDDQSLATVLAMQWETKRWCHLYSEFLTFPHMQSVTWSPSSAQTRNNSQ